MERRAGLPAICLVILVGIAGCGGGGNPTPPAAAELPPTQPIISPAGDQADPKCEHRVFRVMARGPVADW